MSRSLTPAVRRQIVAFDPEDPGSPSITVFCRSLGISRPSFYNVRRRFVVEGNAALNPRSRAPKRAARVYDEVMVQSVLEARAELVKQGWDAGARSIWHKCVDEDTFAGGRVPSVSTIARVLAEAGVVVKNPRKRPRSSYIRFQRAAAMELWQLDAFEYRLFDPDGTKITIYQVLDDSTRFDVGTVAFSRPENGTDAVTAVMAAVAAHGAPQELLSDNSNAFNLTRRGGLTQLQRKLADHGCLAICGRVASPTTQGKNERSHQTLQRFLTAHAPASLERVRSLLIAYREYYNHRRHHQGLPQQITPAQAWASIEHRPAAEGPIQHTEILALAHAKAAQALMKDEGPTPADPQHTATGRLRPADGQVTISAANPYVYLAGKSIRIPTYLTGTHQPVITATEYSLFDTRDGTEAVRIPLPLHAPPAQRVMLWQVKGARIRDPKPSWIQKQLDYHAHHYTPHHDDQPSTNPRHHTSTKP
ncbi:integrase core domain-containing protein [Salana multivorans]